MTSTRITPATMYEAMRRRVQILDEDPDAWVRRMMRWHFSEETGSAFWRRRARHLGFDPIRDITDVAALERFGLFDKSELRTVPVADLVPRGFANRPRRVFETGGTTGDPCRVVDVTTGAYNVAIYRTMLEARGLAGGDALGMTPSGPHAYGTFVARLVDSWAGTAQFIDFDPRWVKALLREQSSADLYIAHLVQQTERLLRSQRPALLFTTSKLLLALAATLEAPLAEFGVRAVCTGGTSCTAEEERFVRQASLGPDVQWIDTYGNTLMGHALQGDAWDGWPRRASYLPPPQAYICVVDPADWRRRVAYGERGRVLVVTLLEDLFVPNLLERDSAIRVRPHPWFPWDGVSDVALYTGPDSEPQTEGVY